MGCMASTHVSKKRRQMVPTYNIQYSKDLEEFPLDNGKTRLDYCPYRCGICLFGILKEDAKCGPCVSHVFHRDCLESWESYLIASSKKYTCPVCTTIDLNHCIFVDGEE